MRNAPLFHHPYSRFAALALALLGSQTLAQTPPEVAQALARPFVRVNQQAQATALAEVLFREAVAKGSPSSPALRESVRESLIQQALMAQDAKAQGLDSNPLVQAQMALASQAALVRIWQQNVLAKQAISDADVQQEYAVQLAQMGTEQWLIGHIVVADEAVAKRLIARLQQGETLAALAAEFSLDPDSKTQGGVVGWVARAQLVPEVAQAMAQMTAPQLWPQPVRTALGWHVLNLQAVRPVTPPALDKIRPQLLELLAQKTLAQKLQELRQKASIE